MISFISKNLDFFATAGKSCGCPLFESLFMFCFQSDMEKEMGLPVAPFMDREKVTKPSAQIGFIKFVLIPMFETVAKVTKLGFNLK